MTPAPAAGFVRRAATTIRQGGAHAATYMAIVRRKLSQMGHDRYTGGRRSARVTGPKFSSSIEPQ